MLTNDFKNTQAYLISEPGGKKLQMFSTTQSLFVDWTLVCGRINERKFHNWNPRKLSTRASGHPFKLETLGTFTIFSLGHCIEFRSWQYVTEYRPRDGSGKKNTTGKPTASDAGPTQYSAVSHSFSELAPVLPSSMSGTTSLRASQDRGLVITIPTKHRKARVVAPSPSENTFIFKINGCIYVLV